MADTEAKTVIVLSVGDPIEAQMDVEAFGHLLASAPVADISFLKVTDAGGIERWINTYKIVQYYSPVEHGSSSF
jgi:hypothetical protein